MKLLYLPLTLFILCFQTVKAQQQSVLIPAGKFIMGCALGDELCDLDEGPEGGIEVYVPAFYIFIHETSVMEYHQCVLSGICQKPFDYKRSHYCNYLAPGREQYPVNCVNWVQAQSYCIWSGGRLANEAEWEKAARSGSNTAFPWGKEPASCKNSVMDPGLSNQSDEETDGCWRDLSWPRGSFKPNKYGLFDVVGGTSEWVMNWYEIDAIRQIYAFGNLDGPKTGTTKVIKGGSWDEKFQAQRVSNRFNKPALGNPDLYGSNGIRCVVTQKTNPN